jgi:hypothetical protein
VEARGYEHKIGGWICASGATRVRQGSLQVVQSGHLCPKTVLRTIARLAEEAGIQEVSSRQTLSRRKVTPHFLRHSHVVNALMAGVPVPMIQIAGWGTRGCPRRRSTPLWRRRWLRRLMICMDSGRWVHGSNREDVSITCGTNAIRTIQRELNTYSISTLMSSKDRLFAGSICYEYI